MKFLASYMLTRKARTFAFSLVEVALALGIFSFALVSIMALFPVVLQNSRDSTDRAASTQIAAAVEAEISQKSFADLSTGGAGSYFFNDRGEMVGAADGPIYEAVTSVDSSDSDQLLRLTVAIRRGANAPPMNTRSFLLFNNE